MGNCRNCGIQKDDGNISFDKDDSNMQEGNKVIMSQLEVLSSVPKSQESKIIMEVRTWQKESYSLYDYENKTNVKEQSFQVSVEKYLQIKEQGFLLNKAQEIVWREGINLIKDENETLLLQLEKLSTNFQIINLRFFKPQVYPETNHEEHNKFEISTNRLQEEGSNYPERLESLNDSLGLEREQNCFSNKQKNQTKLVEKGSKIWLVVRSVQPHSLNQGFKLVEGDTIKLGRVKLIIKEIRLKDYAQNSRIENDIIDHCSSQSIIIGDNSIQCRVCLSYSNYTHNPLINPCKCSGSTKYIHLNCLQMWLKQKLQSRCSEDCTVLLWKNLECELCKFIYPHVFKSDGNTYDLVELSKPKDQPYMMLEFFQKKYQEKDNKDNYDSSNGMYIMFFGKKKVLRMGRAHDLEVSINDISVSRMHANLKQVGNDVFIQDKKSKFGTLVLLQQNIELHPELSGLEIQVGRNLIGFQLSTTTSNGVNQFEQNYIKNFRKLLGREPSDQ